MLFLLFLISLAHAEYVPSYVGSAQYDDPNTQIVNGIAVQPHSYPYQLSLQSGGSGSYRHVCGAILAHERWAITAAHCVEGPIYRVVAGAHIRNCNNCTGVEQVRNVVSITQHPGWVSDGSQGFPNDIALLYLEAPFEIDNWALRVIPRSTGATNFAGDNCEITGWGDTTAGGGVSATELKMATVPIISPEECTEAWGQANEAMHLCFWDKTDTHSSCQGDSGGPMTCREQGISVVAGVTSWGVVGCIGRPGVYTRMSTYNDWLCQITQNELLGCDL
ncbi:unnamed protein product [Owenia fusiformis]|uniref:Uncharacterized protein n=1 Tax=Owenia fusiformis TaxID=6347 RepID=A0A8J1TW93_OWEFU|nr:unnamed protein product [Owenia fusiformis]